MMLRGRGRVVIRERCLEEGKFLVDLVKGYGSVEKVHNMEDSE